VGEHHALGGSGRAGGEDEGEQVVRFRPRPGVDLGLPVGRERRICVGDELVKGDGPERREARGRGIGRISAGPGDEDSRLGAFCDPPDRVGCHPQVEGHGKDARDHRPEVRRRELRCRRRPRQHTIAALEPEGPESPRGETAAASQLLETPVLGVPIVAADPEDRPIGMAPRSGVEDVEQAVHPGHPSGPGVRPDPRGREKLE
jgi:hypothetical protein